MVHLGSRDEGLRPGKHCGQRAGVLPPGKDIAKPSSTLWAAGFSNLGGCVVTKQVQV